MNLVEMRTRLRKMIGNPLVTEITDDTLTDLINDAYVEITDKYAFHCSRESATFNTVAATARYQIPDNATMVMSLQDTTNKTKVTKRSPFWADSQDPTATGSPINYVRYNEWFQLFPIPDAIYAMRIYYKIQVTALVSDSDIPLVPLTWHRGVVLLARFQYYDSITNIPQGKYAEDAYIKWVATKPSELDDEYFYDNDEPLSVLSAGTSLPRQNFDQAD